MILVITLIALAILLILYSMSMKEKFASDGGALIQLVAKDAQDSYLTGSPRNYIPYYSYYYPYYYYPDYPYASYY